VSEIYQVGKRLTEVEFKTDYLKDLDESQGSQMGPILARGKPSGSFLYLSQA
jgi:hypothetical protein